MVLKGQGNNNNSKLDWRGARLKAGKSLSSHYSSPAGHDEMGRKNGEIKFILKNYNKLRWFITNESEKPANENWSVFLFTAWR